MKAEAEKGKKLQTERQRILERARMVSGRVAVKAETTSIEIGKIEQSSDIVIDCFNQQDSLFNCLHQFAQKSGSMNANKELQGVADALKHVSVRKCAELLKCLESTAKNQVHFYSSN